MRKKLFSILLAATLFISCAFGISAHPLGYGDHYGYGNHYGYGDNYGWGEKLTPEQQKDLSRILSQNYTTVVPLQRQLAAKRDELAAQINSPTPDKHRISSLARDIDDLRGRLKAQRMDIRVQLDSAGMPGISLWHDNPYQDWDDEYEPCPYFHGGWEPDYLWRGNSYDLSYPALSDYITRLYDGTNDGLAGRIDRGKIF